MRPEIPEATVEEAQCQGHVQNEPKVTGLRAPDFRNADASGRASRAPAGARPLGQGPSQPRRQPGCGRWCHLSRVTQCPGAEEAVRVVRGLCSERVPRFWRCDSDGGGGGWRWGPGRVPRCWPPVPRTRPWAVGFTGVNSSALPAHQAAPLLLRVTTGWRRRPGGFKGRGRVPRPVSGRCRLNPG